MARKTFLSFHYKPDSWRVSQVKNMGKIEGQSILSSNGWEEIKEKGDKAVEDWIEEQMKGKSCLVVLIGTKTSSRRWVKHEIKEAWNKGKGVLGVYVHNLKDSDGNQTDKGTNPFSGFTVGADKKPMTNYAKTYDPPYSQSSNVYDYVKNNIEDWVEEAIRLRAIA